MKTAFTIFILIIGLFPESNAGEPLSANSIFNPNGFSVRGQVGNRLSHLPDKNLPVNRDSGSFNSLLTPQWNPLENGVSGAPYGYIIEMVVHDGDIYVGGNFNDAGGNPDADYIARWDGCEWQSVAPGLDGPVFAICFSGNQIYVGGAFTSANGDNNISYIGLWDEDTWVPLAAGLNNWVYEITAQGNNVYVGGAFTNAGGNPSADGIARWDGSTWNNLGPGLIPTYTTVAVFTIAISGNNVYAGGWFENAGGNPAADYIAYWNGLTWNDLNAGFDGCVSDIQLSGTDIYVCGYFTGVVAHYDGNSWLLYNPPNIFWNQPSDIEVIGSEIYLGTYDDGLHYFNGNAWSTWLPVSPVLPDDYIAIEIVGEDIYVGGDFDYPIAGNIARWGEPITSIEVPGLNEMSFCSSDPPYILPTTMGGYPGNWAGNGVVNNVFYPEGLNGTIVLTFEEEATVCVIVDESIFNVTPSVSPNLILPTTLCSSALPILLPLVQSGITGDWSGPGVSNNSFDPDGLSGDVVLTFNPDPGQCALAATTTIFIETPFIPIISGIPNLLCELAPPLSLPTSQNNITGDWSGPGINNNIFNLAGLTGTITITFSPDPGACAEEVSTDINIEEAITPTLSGVPNALCEIDPSVSLSTLQEGITGTWSGPGISNNSFDPTGLAGNISISFIPNAGECALADMAVIDVQSVFIPMISGIQDTVCQSSPVLALPSTQSGVTGNWSGVHVSENTFDPSGLNGSITLTFIPDSNQCADEALVPIVVTNIITPVIAGIPGIVCALNDTLALPTNLGGTSGHWSGPGISNDIFNPLGLSGANLILFTPNAGECAVTASTEINVTEAIVAQISGIPDQLCSHEEPVLLSANQNGIFGNWSGPGVANNVFNPSGLAGTQQLLFTPDSNSCAVAISKQIEIIPVIIPNITGIPGSLCQSENAIQLPILQNNITGDWSGPGVNANSFDPSGLVGNLLLSFIPDSNACADSATIQIAIHDAPSYINLITSCDSLNSTYQVIFDIVGGDSASYSINGMMISGTTFSNLWTDNDSTSYSFLLNDQYGCAPVLISGTLNCACATYAGTMEFAGSPFHFCEGSDIVLAHHQDEHLDVDDLLLFVLHDNSGTSLGQVFGTSSTPSFSIPAGIEYGKIYYLSAVAGSINGPGSIDLNDPCLSVSQGVPVVFYPVAKSDFIQTLCDGETMIINGTTYDESHTSGIETIQGGSAQGCDSIIQVQLSFFPEYTHDLKDTLCLGSSILINGTTYDALNPTGTEVFSSSQGCDSTVLISLSFDSIIFKNLDISLCLEDSFIYQSITYDQSNPEGTATFIGAFGCDSVVHLQLNFYPEAIGWLTDTLSDGESIIIQGHVYDQFHTSGVEILPGESMLGCDSTVMVMLTFSAPLSVLTSFILPTCHDEQNAVITLSQINGGVSPYQVMLDGDLPVEINQFPHEFTGLQAGLHQLIITDVTGAKIIVDLDIPNPPKLEVDAGDDQLITSGRNGKLNATSPGFVMNWLWRPGDFLSCTDCPDPDILKPEHEVSYAIEITDADGCTGSDIVTITIAQEENIYVPTVFSPNGDGVNDVLSVFATNDIHNITSFKIYSRWGELVNEQHDLLPNDVTKGWDGRMRGEEMNPGVYVWILEVEKEDGKHKQLTGDVTLIK